MKITYFGHSSFLVEGQDGTSIILDPYLTGSFDGAVKYAPIDEAADAVLASHGHDDHGATDTVLGTPKVVVHPQAEVIGQIAVTGVETAHDEAGGTKRGRNTVMVLDDGDIRLVHLGDLGHLLDTAAVRAIGKVDVLLIPVGGFFTIDHNEAAQVVEQLAPRIVIPMHYKTEKVDFPIAPVDDFLETQSQVEIEESSSLEVSQESLPAERTVIVLSPSR